MVKNWHDYNFKHPSKFDSVHSISNQVKFRRIWMSHQGKTGLVALRQFAQQC